MGTGMTGGEWNLNGRAEGQCAQLLGERYVLAWLTSVREEMSNYVNLRQTRYLISGGPLRALG